MRLSDELMKLLDKLRLDKVVRVDKTKVFAGGFLDAEVASRRSAAIGLVIGFDLLVLLGELPDDLETFVGRAVVDEDDFEIVISLREDRINGLLDMSRGIVDWNDDRDERVHKCIISFIKGKIYDIIILV